MYIEVILLTKVKEKKRIYIEQSTIMSFIKHSFTHNILILCTSPYK